MAIGGSTNAVVHLTAIAGRLGIRCRSTGSTRSRDDDAGAGRPQADRRGYMEDFRGRRHRRRVARAAAAAAPRLPDVDRRDLGRAAGRAAGLGRPRGRCARFDEPSRRSAAWSRLFGTLAPDGAIFKRAAADPALFEGRAAPSCSTSLEDLAARIDDPDLDVTPTISWCCRTPGPSAAGMPEAGYLPIPGKLARAGVKDMVRISDARMSGTAYGIDRAARGAGGGARRAAGAVRNGDRIRLSVYEQRIDLLVEDSEIKRRLATRTPRPSPERGYAALYRRSVLQAPEGCDFDFLAKAPSKRGGSAGTSA